ncbi:chondroitin proteoglycan-2-like [Schistocerca cancellata]|uniref:chondroitin proteoglycan-2-like n=1 Tax=Schistocerca cancellata TaxID=274614 RepID=UPI00211766B6|nr:chondroitin proteoglycan-2-like [Schistocerca cancellata]
MRGLPFFATAVVVVLVGGASAASLRRLTVVSATCQGASGPFPNPNSCRSFLQCEPSGVATVIPCPANLEFNPKLRVCDFPERAGCSSSVSPPANDDSGNGGGSDDNGGASPAPPSGDAPKCPPWNPNDVTQLPNQNDCTSFYKCDENGVAWVISCPAGLEYNAELRVCDYPENAGCSSSSPSKPSDDTPSEGGQDDANSDGGNEVSPNPPAGDAPTCPAWNPNDVTQLPNPNDCSSFYKCDENGVAWLIPCPAGLEYNAKLRVCDYPESAGCSSSGSPSHPSGDDSSDDNQNNGNADSGNGDDASPQQPAENAPTCPAWNPDDVTQLPNPSDCNSFYKCDENGVAWLIPCPAGLQYNAELRVCDYPESSGCSVLQLR